MMKRLVGGLEAYSRYSSYKDGLRIKRSGPCTGFTVRTSGKINLLDETVNEVGDVFYLEAFFFFGVGGGWGCGGRANHGERLRRRARWGFRTFIPGGVNLSCVKCGVVKMNLSVISNENLRPSLAGSRFFVVLVGSLLQCVGLPLPWHQSRICAVNRQRFLSCGTCWILCWYDVWTRDLPGRECGLTAENGSSFDVGFLMIFFGC